MWRCRATVTLNSAAAGVPTVQVVLAESAALRLPAGASGHGSTTFGQDMPAPVPLARWDWEHHAGSGSASGRLPARFGSFLPGDSAAPARSLLYWFAHPHAHTTHLSTWRLPLPAEVTGFDSALFAIGSSEAALLDPQQRLLLEAVWEAAAGSSIMPRSSSDTPRSRPAKLKAGAGAGSAPAADTGVFVGASYAEWMLLQQQQHLPQSTYTASGSGLSVLAGAPCLCAQ